MSKKVQRILLAPPSAVDANGLRDYTSVIQQVFEELYEEAHDHQVLTAAPSDADGSQGDIALVDDGSTTKLYAKFPSGWKSVSLT